MSNIVFQLLLYYGIGVLSCLPPVNDHMWSLCGINKERKTIHPKRLAHAGEDTQLQGL